MEKNIFNEIPEINYSETADSVNFLEFQKIVESRRSVRVYDGTTVPEKVVRQCLDMALLAPNSSNLQPWEFYWVRSKNKKDEIVEACFSQPAARTAAEIIVAVSRTKTWKKHATQMIQHFESQGGDVPESIKTYYKKIVPMAYTIGPFGIVGLIKKISFFFVGLFKVVPREPSSFNDMKIWATKSTALACENLMLAFRAHGYDSCPMEGLDSKRVSQILNLPSDATIVMAISAGKRSSKGVYGPRIRFPRDQFVKEI